MAKKKKIEPKLIRVQENPVTHVLESVVLDPPRLAFERANRAIENAMLAVPTSAGATPRYAIAESARQVLTLLESDQPVPGQTGPLAALVREYCGLQPSEQPRFTALLWEWLRWWTPPHARRAS